MVESLCSSGLASAYSLYPSLSKLLCLLELEEASVAHSPSTSDHPHTLGNLSFLHDWQDRLSHLNRDMKFVDPVLAVRRSVLHSLLRVGIGEVGSVAGGVACVPVEQRRKVEGVFTALSETLLTHSQWAREAQNYQVSFNCNSVSLIAVGICDPTEPSCICRTLSPFPPFSLPFLSPPLFPDFPSHPAPSYPDM